VTLQEIPLDHGWVEPALHAEFPGLGLRYAIVEGRARRSPPETKQRLRHLSDQVHGERVLNLRREPVASAYRIFFRQVGIDPDEFRPPGEAAMLERLRAGRFASHNAVEDALTVAVVETGVAVRAFDAEGLEGTLGLRMSRPRERLGKREPEGPGLELLDGAIVIADELHSIAMIFGDTAPNRVVRRETRRVALCAVQVGGVPDISVEEALWGAAGMVHSAS
jgi:DNA/RNA-binding domain of Phe-tRNA-synthetase-like protein